MCHQDWPWRCSSATDEVLGSSSCPFFPLIEDLKGKQYLEKVVVSEALLAL